VGSKPSKPSISAQIFEPKNSKTGRKKSVVDAPTVLADSYSASYVWASLTPERAFRKIGKARLCYLSDEKREALQKAFVFAEKTLRNQAPINGSPAIYHSLGLVDIIKELQLDATTLTAALLINTEDLNSEKQESNLGPGDTISKLFGVHIFKLVSGAGRLGQIRYSLTLETEAESFRRMLMAMSEDIRVMIIHLANRLQNMRCLDQRPTEERRAIARRTLEIYAPIAERLGLYSWARELQDVCMRARFPNRYKTLNLAMSKREGNRKLVIEKLSESLKNTLGSAGLSDFYIKGRRKTVYSVYRKMVRKNKSFDELYDLYGFRIIVDCVDTCYRVLGMVHTTYKPVHGRFHDYIAIPKANGYQSIHTVVVGPHGDRLEVQIRTREMDRVAEAGIAAHWIYKSDGSNDSDSVNSSQLAREWLVELLDPTQHSGNPIEFLEHLKADLYPDEVYVFTPTGDIRKLPRGATALDFAFSVHTKVGLHCAGVRINASLATMPTVLQNGDRVEIITNEDASPTTAWLNYATSGKARSQIRNFLRNQTSEEALALGKRLLAGATKQRLFGRRKISAKVQAKLLAEFGLDTWSDLLIEIGQGIRVPGIVAQQVARLSDVGVLAEGQEEASALVIRGSEGLMISYSKCCSPIPGDPIIGAFTAGHGLAIHTSDCNNTAELRRHPDRCLMVDWDENLDSVFHVRLQVKVNNVAGAFAEVATAIAENGSNINNVDVHEGLESVIQIDFVVDVKDRAHLAKLIRSIYRKEKVAKVTRQNG